MFTDDESMTVQDVLPYPCHTMMCLPVSIPECCKVLHMSNFSMLHLSIWLPHAVRRIRCTPLSVLMTSLISPTLSEYVASSNGFCIWP